MLRPIATLAFLIAANLAIVVARMLPQMETLISRVAHK